MARGRAVPITLSERERTALSLIAGRTFGRQAMALRAGIVLLAAEGLTNRTISDRLRLEEHCVGRWRRRFIREGVWGLFDRPRPGRRRAAALPDMQDPIRRIEFLISVVDTKQAATACG